MQATATLAERIDALDDKQAIHVAGKLAEAVFTNQPEPTREELARAFDAAGAAAAVPLTLARHDGWNTVMLHDAGAGDLARAVLHGWAEDDGLAPAVEQAMTRFKSAKQDFGVISIGVGIGLAYVLIAMKARINLGPLGVIEKEGLTAAQQASVVKATAAVIAKALGIK
jgi:hypothetical protein